MGPQLESATVERREGPGRPGIAGSRLARATEGKTSAPVGAPSTPRSGVMQEEANRDNEKYALT